MTPDERDRLMDRCDQSDHERGIQTIHTAMAGVMKDPSAPSPLEQALRDFVLKSHESRELYLGQQAFNEYERILDAQKLLDRAVEALTVIRDRGTIEPTKIGEILTDYMMIRNGLDPNDDEIAIT